MEVFTVQTTLDRNDWQALLRAANERVHDSRGRGSLLSRALPRLAPSVAAVAVALLIWFGPSWLDINSFAAGVVLIAAVFVITAFVQRRLYAPASKGAFVGTTTFHFARGGIDIDREHSRSRINWPLVDAITQTPTHIFIWVDAISAYTIRVQDLPAPTTGDEAVARLRAYAGAATAQRSPDTPVESIPAASSPAATALSTSRALPSVGQELLALLGLWIRGHGDSANLHGRDLTIALLGAFDLLLVIACQRFDFSGEEGGAVEFLWWGVPALTQYVAAVLLVAWAAARLAIPPLPVRRTLLLVLGAAPVLTIVWSFVDYLPRLGCIAVAVLFLFGLSRYVVAGLRITSGMRQPRAAGSALLLMGALLYASMSYWVSAQVWYSPDVEEDAAGISADLEQLSFEQPVRIDARIARMSPSSPDAASIYFVGFAGYGDQRVFAEEIAKAASVVAARYHTGERQLLLINDRRDVEKEPYATTPSLRYALAQIGKRMNLEQDVLFLALSSHGSEDATLSVSNELGFWDDVSGEKLREALDASGIRWRVIVISACHAGSFIEHLQDDRTIVLTAAAKDRTSFGCSDDRDLTYFGEAFYRDALPSAMSLRTAFDAARAAINERETKEKQSRSNPQASFGSLMEAKFEELEKTASR